MPVHKLVNWLIGHHSMFCPSLTVLEFGLGLKSAFSWTWTRTESTCTCRQTVRYTDSFNPRYLRSRYLQQQL